MNAEMNARGPVRWRPWSAVVVALVLIGAAVVIWPRLGGFRAPPLPVYGTVPEFSLVERSGRMVTRSDLLGKVSVVDFFYTRCPDTCPLQSAHLARLQAELAGTPDLLLVSITVDPDFDDRAVLSSYAARFRADRVRWLFLTGPRDAIYRLAVDGFHLAAIASRSSERAPLSNPLAPASAWAHDETASPRIIRLVHASRFALVDRQAQIRGYFDGTDWDDVERMRTALGRLVARRAQ